jgi:hypothetical protein
MLMLLGAALLALTSTRCNCGYDCHTLGEARCFNGTDPNFPHPHGALYEICVENIFAPNDPKYWLYLPVFCSSLVDRGPGDGGSAEDCPNNMPCWDHYCYCPPVH